MANAGVPSLIGKLRSVFLTGAYTAFRRCVPVMVLIAIVLYAGVSIGHAHTASRVVAIAPYLLPGNPLPDNAQCDESHSITLSPVVHCKVLQNPNSIVYLILDEQTIVQSSYAVKDAVVGDFIGAWGVPNAYAGDRYTCPPKRIYLYWNTKEAMVAIPVDEDSPVLVVTYYQPASDFPFPHHAWHGFGELDCP